MKLDLIPYNEMQVETTKIIFRKQYAIVQASKKLLQTGLWPAPCHEVIGALSPWVLGPWASAGCVVGWSLAAEQGEMH